MLSQTHHSFELLIIDDGSSDNTEAIVRSFSDHRIRYLRHAVNMGQNAALNTGLGISNGKFIAFLDSDDEWLPIFLASHYKVLSKSSLPACSYCWAGKGTTGSSTVINRFSVSGRIYKQALRQGFVSHMITLVIHRECLLAVDSFDPAFTVCQDDDFCLRLSRNFEFHLIPQVLAIVHDTPGSLISHRLNYARGWEQFIHKFRSEIIRECGGLVYLWHQLRVGKYYIEAGHIDDWADRSKVGLFTRVKKIDTFLTKAYFKLLNILYKVDLI